MAEERKRPDILATLSAIPDVLSLGLFLVVLCLFISAALLLGSDLLAWAQSGVWDPASAWGIVSYLPDVLADWIAIPRSWLGIRDVVVAVLDLPGWFAALLWGMVLGLLWVVVARLT